MATTNELAGLIRDLRTLATSSTVQDNAMQRAADMLERLSPTEPQVERVAKAIMAEVFFLAQPDRGDVFSWLDDHSDRIARAALSSTISNAEVEDRKITPKCPICGERNNCYGNREPTQCPKHKFTTEDSGEVVQAGAKEPWEVLRDIVTPSPFSHNKAAWSIMLGLIQRDHRLAARQSPDSPDELLSGVWAQGRENHRLYSATGDKEGDIRFHTLGMAGEAGEVANFVKKRWRDGDGHDEDIRKEIADVCAYAFMLADTMGMSPADLMGVIAEKQAIFIAKMQARASLSNSSSDGEGA